MKAVILAAGIGSRIKPLTDTKPKSLIEVDGKPILERMLESIRAIGISDVAIIVGYLPDQIREFALSKFPNIKFTFIKNDKYAETNTGYSLLLAKNFIGTNPFFKFDADVVFESAILQRLLQSSHESCLAIDKDINLDAEEIKVITDDKGKVIEIGKKIDPKKASGESIGIEKIGPKASQLLFLNLENLMTNPKNYQQYYDDQYGVITQSGVPFYAVDITGLKWVEIDTHEDYQKAIKLFSRS